MMNVSFKKNNEEQLSLFSKISTLSERDMRFLKQSPMFKFGEVVFPKINEERFAVLYSDHKFSRPNTPVNVIIGALIIKEMLGLTDEELFESILFDVRLQYALHTTNALEQPFSDRTLSRFRERLAKYEMATGIDLLKDEVVELSTEIAKCMNIKGDLKRMDSLMISAHCKKLSRLQLFYTTISDMVKLVFENEKTGKKLIPKFEHYLSKEDMNNVVYRCKSEDTQSKLDKAVKDALRLKKLCADFQNTKEYQHLCRLIEEQVSFNDSKPKAKSGKEISPSSMQSPVDTDATFRRKAGQNHIGYVGNVVETLGEDCSIITDFDYQPNTYSDNQFCKDVIENIGKQDEKVTLIADGAYHSEENTAKAKENNIELIATALTGQAPAKEIANFELSENKEKIVKCPLGKSPIKCTHSDKAGTYRAVMERKYCANCPYQGKCKVKFQKNTAVITISEKTIARAKYLEKLSSEEYQELRKKRNGVEGIPSVMRRRYLVDQIPTYGKVRSKLWFTLKICAINIVEYIKWVKSEQERRELFQILANILFIFDIFYWNLIFKIKFCQYRQLKIAF